MALLALALGCLAALPASDPPVDLTKIERAVRQEPPNKTKARRYCLLVFGPKADYRVWLIRDGATLFVDRNGDGDLTQPGESGGLSGDRTILHPDGKTPARFKTTAGVPPGVGRGSGEQVTRVAVEWHGRWFGAWGDETGGTAWGATPASAPILHFDGPLQMGFEVPAASALRRTADGEYELNVGVGTYGLGVGSFVHLRYWNDAIPEGVFPAATLDFPAREVGGPPVRVTTKLKERC